MTQGILKPIGEVDQLTSQTNPETQTIRERLMEKFQMHEFVRVLNIDSEPYRFEILPPNKETTQQLDPATQRVYRAARDVYEIPAGDSSICEGWKAYVLIEGLLKKVIQKRYNVTQLNNVALQNDLIKEIFLGVEDPFAQSLTPSTSPQDLADDVEKDLGLTNVRRGRPTKPTKTA